jgi:phosphatidate cytidylyltransferase
VSGGLRPAGTLLAGDTLVLFAGIGGLLVLASAITWALRRRATAAGRPANPTLANLDARVRAWWVMVLVVASAFWLGRTAVIVLFGLLSFLALREFITLTPTRRGDHRSLVLAFLVIVPAQYLFVWLDRYGMFSIFIPVYAFLFLPILAALSSDTTRFLERSSKVQWGLMIAVYCLSHVPALLILQIEGYGGRNALLLFFLIFVVQVSDVLQYVWGKLFGRHKIAPELSPSKTVEGFAGGVLSASALGAALWWITPFTPWQAAAMTLIATLMGFFGGLVMSAIKRDFGVKDWGSMIEGHGGTLDRLDSLCFAAPVFFHLVRFYFGN